MRWDCRVESHSATRLLKCIMFAREESTGRNPELKLSFTLNRMPGRSGSCSAGVAGGGDGTFKDNAITTALNKRNNASFIASVDEFWWIALCWGCTYRND